MNKQTLLVELFTEELPPKVLKNLGYRFAGAINDGLKKRGLVAHDETLKVFATPRRLAVLLSNVRSIAPDEAFAEKLMPVTVGLDKDGKATPALLKKLAAKSLGHIQPSDLSRESDGKADQLVYRGTATGQSLQVGLQSALEEAIAGLPVPKVMSYQLADGVTTVQFVRPAHGLVALHGADVVPVHALGIDAGRTTHGHRFQGAIDIELKSASEYEARLEKEGGVIASFEKRRDEIKRLLFAHAEQTGDTLGEPEDCAALLDEVTALVERPTVYVGTFDAEFLEVPAECLVLTMKLNQKYFPLFLSEGGLSSRFLIVSNMRLDNPQNVIEGNQRVVRPRLADARFFFETDKKTKLEERLPKLANVVYLAKLGAQSSQLMRVNRVRKLAGSIALLIGADANLVDRAALLAKADLGTGMVGEFPELQGIMGRHYALHDHESPIVADAIAQHYQPRFAGDKLPEHPVALTVALADKMETLAGLFAVGQQPSGDKDPFALRRHALGVSRILIERKLDVDLLDLVNPALKLFEGFGAFPQTELLSFILDRARGYLRDQGYSVLEIEAVLGRESMRLSHLPAQLAAVREFMKLPEAASLAAANKRIGNILKKTDREFGGVDRAQLVEPAEIAMFEAMQAASVLLRIQLASGDYTAALKSLAPLKAPVDAFFDGVMVNVEDVKLRENRLAMLGDLHALMNRVADLSKLAA